MTKFIQLKQISIESIEKSGPDNSTEFKQGLALFALQWLKDFAHCNWGFREDLGTQSIEVAKKIPGAIQFLLDHKFISKKVVRPDLKVDHKVRVFCGTTKAWLAAHFARWDNENDVMRVYSLGKTSWTTIGTDGYSEWNIPEE